MSLRFGKQMYFVFFYFFLSSVTRIIEEDPSSEEDIGLSPASSKAPFPISKAQRPTKKTSNRSGKKKEKREERLPV